jgi:hypothetical protein
VEGAGVLVGKGDDWALTTDVTSFVQAIGRHRNWDRGMDPPMV